MNNIMQIVQNNFSMSQNGVSVSWLIVAIACFVFIATKKFKGQKG